MNMLLVCTIPNEDSKFLKEKKTKINVVNHRLFSDDAIYFK